MLDLTVAERTGVYEKAEIFLKVKKGKVVTDSAFAKKQHPCLMQSEKKTMFTEENEEIIVHIERKTYLH